MPRGAAAVQAGGGYLVRMSSGLFRTAGRRGRQSADAPPPGGQHVDDVAATNRAIDEALTSVNPRYGRVSLKKGIKCRGDEGYTRNCQVVASVYELRRRGMNVRAGGRDAEIAEAGWTSFRWTWGREATQANREEIIRAFQEFGPGSRGIISCHWRGGGGHQFNVENVGGEVRFIDAQINDLSRGRDVSWFFDRMEENGSRYVRLDDLPLPDEAILNRMVERM